MHRFVTSCVSALGEDITEMCAVALNKEISNGHFIKTIATKNGIKDEVLRMLGYDTMAFFANDWAMSCHKSFYQGIPCYYVRHSAIEYVFVDKHDYDKVEFDHDVSVKRHDAISDLEDLLAEHMSNANIDTPSEMYKAMKAFYLTNKEVLVNGRILMSSLTAYATPYRETAALIDKKLHLNELTSARFMESANLRNISIR